MKKIISMLLLMTMLLCGNALAMDMGVQLLSQPEEEAEPINLDDIKLDVEIPIEGYGTVKFYEYQVVDSIKRFRKNDSNNAENVNSGVEAQYVLVKADILNTTTEAKKYGSTCEVKVFYDEVFEFGGWNYQYNYNWNRYYDAENTVLNTADNFDISPMYQGHYCFGVTLPNAVFDTKAPMKMVIKIDDHEFTYHIRREAESTTAN